MISSRRRPLLAETIAYMSKGPCAKLKNFRSGSLGNSSRITWLVARATTSEADAPMRISSPRAAGIPDRSIAEVFRR